MITLAVILFIFHFYYIHSFIWSTCSHHGAHVEGRAYPVGIELRLPGLATNLLSHLVSQELPFQWSVHYGRF